MYILSKKKKKTGCWMCPTKTVARTFVLVDYEWSSCFRKIELLIKFYIRVVVITLNHTVYGIS